MIEMTHVHGFCTLCAKNEKRIAELEAEVERLNGSGLLCPPGYTCYWRKQRILGLQGGGRESDTSGEASPTRVASPPRRRTIKEPDDRHALCWDEPCSECQAEEAAAPTRVASPPRCTCALIVGLGPCPQHGSAAARKERDDG